MRPVTRASSLLLACLLARPLLLEAQTPRGPEIVVSPAGGGSPADAAVAANGSFAVTWVTPGLAGKASQGRFRLYRADGVPRTPELRVSASPWDQTFARLAMRPDGRFVVVWSERVPGHFRVLGRRFAADGTPLGAPFRLTPTVQGDQFEPDVAMAPDGSFVAAWTSTHASLPVDVPDIFARRFSPEGRPRGPEFLVNEDQQEVQSGPRVAVGADRSFVVGWSTWATGGDFYDPMGQRFAADGTPRGEPLLLADDPDGNQTDLDLTMAPDGGFVSVHGNVEGDGILAKRYAPDGTATGSALEVNASPRGAQHTPSIAASPTGFLVTWTHTSTSTRSEGALFGRRLSPDGTPVGPEIQISTGAFPHNADAAVALNASGQGVAAWTAYDFRSRPAAVLARRLVQKRPR